MNVNIFININMITLSGCIMSVVLNRAFNTEMWTELKDRDAGLRGKSRCRLL